MLKILQAKLQQYVNFQMFKLDLEKAEEPEIKLPTSAGWGKAAAMWNWDPWKQPVRIQVCQEPYK